MKNAVGELEEISNKELIKDDEKPQMNWIVGGITGGSIRKSLLAEELTRNVYWDWYEHNAFNFEQKRLKKYRDYFYYIMKKSSPTILELTKLTSDFWIKTIIYMVQSRLTCRQNVLFGCIGMIVSDTKRESNFDEIIINFTICQVVSELFYYNIKSSNRFQKDVLKYFVSKPELRVVF